MNLFPAASVSARHRKMAFTMIEIAIALAVIAFALVAIIGVLPTGMNVQKDNREDTIINQDGPYWMEAIRAGNRGLDYLTNYVESITLSNSLGKTIYTNSSGAVSPPLDNSMTNGARIISLLSTPKYTPGVNPGDIVTNYLTARVRALSGAALEQGTNNPDFAFAYQLSSEITPFQQVPVSVISTNFNEPGLTNQNEIDKRKALWAEVNTRAINTTEVRLVFRWPLLPPDRTGPNRQIFRSIISGVQGADTNGVFFEPQFFITALPPP
ncbi:MAG: hypothetical protein ABJC04_09945 [Verrucomicrobiota bacterium]